MTCLSAPGHSKSSWVTVSAGFERRPISRILGERWNWEVRDSISRESVAEKSSVWRWC